MTGWTIERAIVLLIIVVVVIVLLSFILNHA